jgi:hypothetical protein
MIIKATLITLVVILVIVIVTSYYVNKEGFDDITNSLESAINTVTPEVASLLNKSLQAAASMPSAASQLTATPSSAATPSPSVTSSSAATPSPSVTPDATSLLNNLPPTSTDSSSTPISTNSQFRSILQPSPNSQLGLVKLVQPGTQPSQEEIDRYNQQTKQEQQIKDLQWEIKKLNIEKRRDAATTPSSSTTATTPSITGSSPTRTDVVPEVKFSEDGYNALILQQKADLLKDLQKVVRNEVLANRSTTPMLYNNGCGLEDDKHGCEPVKEHGCANEDVPKNECGLKSAKDKVTAAISQGKEYENSCYKDKKADVSCPPQPDMAQFIKKDAIPCWGCDLDY